MKMFIKIKIHSTIKERLFIIINLMWNCVLTFVVIFLISLAHSKLIMEKLDIHFDLQYAEVVSSVKEIDGQSVLNIDVESFFDGDDVILNVAIMSKIDGEYNPIIRPAPINMCTLRDHEEPLVQFLHREIQKFGNITNACPPKIGPYYVHGFSINQTDFPILLPNGEFRLDLNSSFMDDGVEKKIASSELYFKTT